MKLPTIAALALVAFVSAAQSEVTVSVDQISDNRTTGGFFKGLELVLKLKGPELLEAKGMSLALDMAKDDLGTDISKIEHSFGSDAGGFEPLEKKFGRDDKDNEYEHKLKLPNPARAAKKIMLSGAMKLMIPGKDPASIITLSPGKEAGKAIDNALLKAGGAEITFSTPKGDEAGYKISDPKGIVASVEFCTAAGKPLETSGRMSSSFGGPKTVTISFSDKPPADMVAKIYLITAKSVVTVPLKFDSIMLP